MIPDWQLPPGVDRGLWDYLHSDEMVAGYDRQMAASPLAEADIAFCDEEFRTPGRFIDLGCGTGRLAIHFAKKGFDCVGVDLSEEMLKQARTNAGETAVHFQTGNLTAMPEFEAASFDYAACLFSTFGMIRGDENRRAALAEFNRILKPGGRLVLHVHNRYFIRSLGLKGFLSGDVTMRQAYGGAPLTIRHFGRGEIVKRLTHAGFRFERVMPVGLIQDSKRPIHPKRRAWFGVVAQPYGYLLSAVKPMRDK
jgi:SAM-dependent methyltransferase